MRRLILLLIFTFTAIHFLKDITQDILHIATPLDVFGNIQEDLSAFPLIVQSIFYIVGVSSFIAEIFLMVAIPWVIKRKTITKLEKLIYIMVGLMIIYFITVLFLDPRFTVN